MVSSFVYLSIIVLASSTTIVSTNTTIKLKNDASQSETDIRSFSVRHMTVGEIGDISPKAGDEINRDEVRISNFRSKNERFISEIFGIHLDRTHFPANYNRHTSAGFNRSNLDASPSQLQNSSSEILKIVHETSGSKGYKSYDLLNDNNTTIRDLNGDKRGNKDYEKNMNIDVIKTIKNIMTDIKHGDINIDRESAAMNEYLARARRLRDPDSLARLGVTCEICEYVVGEVRALVRAKHVIQDVLDLLSDVCTFVKYTSRKVCVMAIESYQEQIIYIANHLVLSPPEVCGIVLGGGCATPYFPGHWWNVTLPSIPKPPVLPPIAPKPDAPKLRILQLTDLHIDLRYKQGSPTDCGDPMCCRPPTNSSISEDHYLDVSKRASPIPGTAGKYGSYDHCDLPTITTTHIFEHLKFIQDQFDIIYFTGDIPPHDIWNQTKENQIESIHILDMLFQKYLPTKPVYHAVGNHESAPCNSFPPPGIPNHNMTWLYTKLADVWGRWLPPSQIKQVIKCGSFSHSPYPGFRIISVNDNYCNVDNFWLLLNSTDPCQNLQWLVEELQNAENKGEKVHLLLHLPPGGSECYKAWSWNFYKIVNRYESTIVNQFYGHDHHDWFLMFYDDLMFQRPVSVGFAAPSVTTYSYTNPAYRIYTIDGTYNGSSWAVLDYTTYYLNLTKANAFGILEWITGYSAKQDLKMSGLYAADWDDLASRLDQDDNLFKQFYSYYTALHPTSQCEGKCKSDILCKIREGRSFDPYLCHRIS